MANYYTFDIVQDGHVKFMVIRAETEEEAHIRAEERAGEGCELIEIEPAI